MAGVYGEFLGFYSELFEDFEVYKQTPDNVSGYTLTFSKKIRGIKQSNDVYTSKDKYKSIPVLDIGRGYWLWTYEKIELKDEFVKIDGKYYRPMNTSEFNREGGFYETRLEMVVGNDGTKNLTPPLAEGEF